MRKALILVLGLTSIAVGCKKPPPAKPVSFGIFEIVDCSTSHTAPIPLRNSDARYCIAASPVVSEKDIRAAVPGHNEDGNPVLNLYFTRAAGDRMRAATQRLVEKHAQMAIVIDGKLFMAPEVRSVIADSLVVSADFRKEELEELAASLSASRP
jgi:preprotein translocase subunit SecD